MGVGATARLCHLWLVLFFSKQVEERPGRVCRARGPPRWHAIPVVHKRLGCGDSLEYGRGRRIGPLGWRIAIQMTADRKDSSAAIVVRDAKNRQPSSIVGQGAVADIVAQDTRLVSRRHF